MSGSRTSRRILSLLFALLASLVQSGPAQAGPDDEGSLTALRIYLERETSGLSGRTEIIVGSLDPRLRLAPCRQVEPFLPQGTRLWGKAMIGLRCHDAAGWTAYLPVEIKVWGEALVAVAGFAAGQSLGSRDVRSEEVELTRESGALTAATQLSDRMLVRAVVPGQVLRQDHFRIRPLVNAGDMVRVIYRGNGFTVSSEGRAIGQAQAGQSLRVRTSSGKMLAGIVQAGRVVEISF